MDVEKCKKLREKLDSILAKFTEELKSEFNVVVKIGNGKYTPGEFGSLELKVELSEINSKGIVENKTTHAFHSLSKIYGFEPDDLGKPFNYNGSVYKIVGLAPRSDKFPVIVARQDGKQFKMPSETVLSALHKK